MRLFTNRLFLQVTLTLSLLMVFLVSLNKIGLCERGGICSTIVDTIEPLDFLLFVPIILLPLAVIFIFIDNRIFKVWKKFAIWGIPVLLISTYLVTRDASGRNFFSMDFSLYFLAIIYGLFFFFSLIIIAVTTYRNKWCSFYNPPKTWFNHRELNNNQREFLDV